MDNPNKQVIPEEIKCNPEKETPLLEHGVNQMPVLSDPKPKWLNLEPKEKSDPFPLEMKKFLKLPGNWCMVGVSQRGKKHAHDAIYREDAFAFNNYNGWSVIAVADGAGSCRLSRIGANLACDTAVETLSIHLKDFHLNEDDSEASKPDESDLLKLKSFLILAMSYVQKAIREKAQKINIDAEELSTTLLLVIHRKWKDKNIVASIQVGDGAIAICDHAGKVTLRGNPDRGSFAGETRFILTKGIENEFDHRIFFSIKDDINAIAVMTDGVADDYFPYEDMFPELFKELLHRVNDLSSSPDVSLEAWIRYEKRGSFDDRTLVLLYMEE